MIVTGPNNFVPGYINYDDLVEGALEGVVEHRESTRQRHLSGSNDDIASSYFASQFGGNSVSGSAQAQKYPTVGGSRNNSRTTSRRNSCSSGGRLATACSNNVVMSTMATAAAKIAAMKNTGEDTTASQKNSGGNVEQNGGIHQNSLGETYDVSSSEQVQQQHQQQIIQQQHQPQIQHKQQEQQQKQEQKVEQPVKVNSRQGSRRSSKQMSYIDLLPEDGSFPHRTQPIGDPATGASKTGTASNSPDRARKWSISSSMDYINKTGKTNYAVRSNPIGLAEPSVKRDGYAVGKDGSMYRSNGNLQVAGGNPRSRATSQTPDRDISKNPSWKERRASSSDVVGTGIRVGGNLVEPSTRPPTNSFNMPFGFAAGGGGNRNFAKTRKVSATNSSAAKTVQQQQQQQTVSQTTRHQESSQSQTRTTLESVTQALNKIQMESETVNVTVARRPTRAQSMPRGRVTNEETSFLVSLPGSARTSRQSSVEPERQRRLVRHGSVEVFDGSYNLTVPNKASRHGSQTKLEEVHTDHHFIPGREEEILAQSSVEPTLPQPEVKCLSITVQGKPTETKTAETCNSVSGLKSEIVNVSSSSTISQVVNTSCQVVNSSCEIVNSSSQIMNSSSQVMNSTSQQMVSEEQMSTMSSSSSSSVSMQQQLTATSSSTLTSSSSSSNQQQQHNTSSHSSTLSSAQESWTSSQLRSSSTQPSLQNRAEDSQKAMQRPGRANPASGCQVTETNDTVVQGNRFNIVNGLKRSSRYASEEDLKKSTQYSVAKESASSVKDLTAGSALKVLDSALQQISDTQKRKEEVEYVARVTSRQTSRRGSVSGVGGGEDVVSVTVSLPPSRNNSRATSRRNSQDMGARGRGSRRNSLDIFTAEYSVKLNSSNKVKAMEQRTAFHIKVDNEEESGLNLCGRCHLPTHKTANCTEFNDAVCPRCLSWDHWEDSCPCLEPPVLICDICNTPGHVEEVHSCEKYKQRRVIIDALGWEQFQPWFYEPDFRNWWQVTGCVGVPLYRIYQRKSEWRTERKAVPQGAAKSGVVKTDSVDDMIAQVMKKRIPVPVTQSRGSSGRSTPEHIRNIEVNMDDIPVKARKTRTFSETLRMLDDDILSELDVK